jgi:hypothetical protein
LKQPLLTSVVNNLQLDNLSRSLTVPYCRATQDRNCYSRELQSAAISRVRITIYLPLAASAEALSQILSANTTVRLFVHFRTTLLILIAHRFPRLQKLPEKHRDALLALARHRATTTKVVHLFHGLPHCHPVTRTKAVTRSTRSFIHALTSKRTLANTSCTTQRI